MADNFTFTSAGGDRHSVRRFKTPKLTDTQMNFSDRLIGAGVRSGNEAFVKDLPHKNGKSFRNVAYFRSDVFLRTGKCETH